MSTENLKDTSEMETEVLIGETSEAETQVLVEEKTEEKTEEKSEGFSDVSEENKEPEKSEEENKESEAPQEENKESENSQEESKEPENSEESKEPENSEESKEPEKSEDTKSEEKVEEKIEEPAPIKIELPQDESKGKKIYSWLLEGEKASFPFVMGGGLLVFLAFLIDTIAGYGATAEVELGSITPVAALLKYMGMLSMALMVPILAGYIAKAIAGKEALAVGIVGGFFAYSGNALIDAMSFTGKELFDKSDLGAFNQFIAGFAFEQSKGGVTVSGFLGGILAGFIAGFLILGLKKACENMSDSMESVKTIIIYPIVGIVVISLVMCFIVNPVTAFVNQSMLDAVTSLAEAGMLSVLGLLLGAMVAVDMGGAFSKAAYTFGIGMLGTAATYMKNGVKIDDPKVQTCYMIMAAIMVGSMVPSFGIAVSTWIFRNKFTAEERAASIPSGIMGISSLMEGSIPYAIADPLRVISSSVLGAGVAGLLSMLFKCTITVPVGGIFTLASVGNIGLFIVAWLIGSAITCVTLGFMKREVEENVN